MHHFIKIYFFTLIYTSFFTYRVSAQNIQEVLPGIYKIQLGKIDTFTPSNFRENSSKNSILQQLPKSSLPFNLENVQITINHRGVKIGIPLNNNEQLYGFGLQIGSFKQNGLRKKPIVNDNPLNNLGYTHAPLPYYVSNKGYAVLVNTSRYTTFYCGNNQPKKLNTKTKKQDNNTKLSVEDLYTTKSYTANDQVLVDVPGAKGIEVYIFTGPTIKQAVQRYNLFAGGGAMPAIWGLGVKYRVKADFKQEDVYKTATYFRQKHIPIDVIGLEPRWQTATYPCSFVWNRDFFPNPRKMITNLKKQGFHVNLWEHAFISNISPLYKPLEFKSGDYLGFNGLVPDFADQETRNLFANYHENNLVNMGVSGFKMDECDNSDLRYGQARWSFPELSQFPSGIDGEQMHQLFGLLYQKTIYSIYKKRNQRTYLDVRSSNAFASPYPAALYSDTYDHEQYVEMISNSGFSGLLWSPEVRESSSFQELARRSQTAILAAQTLYNSWYLQNPPWLQYDKAKNNKNKLLADANTNEAVIKTLLNFRMRLIPYLYNAFYQYQSTGLPVFRALVMDYPNDENTFDVADEYMIGDNLLAAPIVGTKNSRSVYLPKGIWYDFNTNKTYEGGKNYTVSFNLDDIPIFIKKGTILPLADPIDYVDADTSFNLTCYVYGKPLKTMQLFEDDGITYNYEHQQFNIITLTLYHHKIQVKRTGNYKTKRYHIKKTVFIP
ncbi:TIM-barrel domain-containing protein [Zhouia sp. PK063]|uniref:glycoside hydrolase family 31 protein n=1 Tax=Zhouia sp. PK063 TaxID=3373602 RepID=UPI00378EBC74